MDNPMNGAHLDAESLGDLAEGLLAPSARRDAEAHLAGCAACRRELEAVQGYFEEMKALPTLKAPDRFLTRVHGRIARTSPWRRVLAALYSPRLLPVPLTALAVMLIGIYYLWLSPQMAGQAEQAAPTVALSSEAEPALAPAAPAMGVRETEPLASSQAPEPAKKAPAERMARYGSAKSKAAKPVGRRLGQPEAPIAAAPSSGPAEREPGARSDDPLADRLFDEQAAAGNGSAGGLAGAPPETRRRVAEALALAETQEKEREDAAAADHARTDGNDVQASEEAGPPPAPAAKAEAGSPRPVFTPADPATTAKSAKIARPDWPPVAYTLRWDGDPRSGGFAEGLTALGIRILRREAGRVELEVPPAKVAALEAYLKRFGEVSPIPTGVPGKPAGAPLRLTLQLLKP